MHRFLPVLLLLFPIIGCADGGVPPAGPPGPTAQLRAGFPPRGLADTIVVDAVERLPLRVAELVAPEGATTPASYIDVADSPRFATGQWVAGDPWRNALSGSGGAAALTLHHTQAGAALQSQQQLLASRDVVVSLIKDGDHRLSSAADLARLAQTLDALVAS